MREKVRELAREQGLGLVPELALVLEQALVRAQQVLLELELVQELAQLVLVWVQQEQVLVLQERVQLVLDLELQQALVAVWVLVLALVRLEPEELQAARPRQELAREQEWVELEAILRVLELVRHLQELEPEEQG